MPRRFGWVLTLASYLPVVSGWAFAVHHAPAANGISDHSQCRHDHSDSSEAPQSEHDSEQCTVCHLLSQTNSVELLPGVSLPEGTPRPRPVTIPTTWFSPDPIPLTVAGPRAPPVL